MSILATIMVMLGAVGIISVFLFLARAARKKSENKIKYKLVYEMTAILTVIVLLLISLLVVPFQTVKTVIIVLLLISVLAVPINLVFGLQRYLFNRHKKTWHLIVIAITQFIFFAVPAYWLLHQLEQGVENGTIDGPSGLFTGMSIFALTFAMMIIWVINSITAGIVFFRLRNR